MLSDDVYRSQLSRTFADLVRETATLTDVAEVTHAQTGEYVRLSLLPYAHGACPVEVMLRADQFYDIAIGSEFYEDCRIEALGTFLPLIDAITHGHVVQRRYLSAVTDAELALETLVVLPDGQTWRKGHAFPGSPDPASERVVCEDRRFVPYRR